MTAVNDVPLSWANRFADLRSWSSSRMVVRMRHGIPNMHQYVKQVTKRGSAYDLYSDWSEGTAESKAALVS